MNSEEILSDGPSRQHNTRINAAAFLDSAELIPAGALWKYLDNGTAPGSDWKSISFVDTAWKSGYAEFGYGDSDETTIINYGPDPQHRFITTYFRKKFTVTDVSRLISLNLKILRDDGAVVYLNGTEVFRTNMPQGQISHNTLASSGVSENAENAYFRSLIYYKLLVAGENCIAVEVHQYNAASSDLSFNFKLIADTGLVTYSPDVFAVIGDYGNNSPAEAAVAKLIKSWNPGYIITLGDNNLPNGSAHTIDANIGQYFHVYIYPYAGFYGRSADTNRFFPALGNHDWNTPGVSPFLNYFTLPGKERYYDFVKGNLHFFCIDSDTHEPDGSSDSSLQGLWLKAKLSSSSSKWKIVYFHHSPFSSDDHHGSQVRMQWPFKNWGADIVLSGHSHIYERISHGGLTYIVAGTGGQSLYSFENPIPGSIVRYSGGHGALRVQIKTDTLWFSFYNINNQLIDKFPLVKDFIQHSTTRKILTGDTDADSFSGLFVVYPDPSTGLFILEFCRDSVQEETLTVEINDLEGKQIYHRDLVVQNECIMHSIRFEENTRPGIYILNVRGKTLNENQKIILTK